MVKRNDYTDFVLKNYVLNQLIYLLWNKFKNLENLSFIQIGASDGEISDPIYQAVQQFNWTGVAVEPLKASFERLKERFKDKPDVKLENVAISSHDGIQTLYKIREDTQEKLVEWSHQIASFDRQHLLKFADCIPDIENKIVTEEVECKTLGGMLEKHFIKEVDLLQIDAEGYDYQIFKMIDFSTFSPTVINLEYIHMSRDHLVEIIMTLIDQNYSFYCGSLDLTAWKKK